MCRRCCRRRWRSCRRIASRVRRRSRRRWVIAASRRPFRVARVDSDPHPRGTRERRCRSRWSRRRFWSLPYGAGRARAAAQARSVRCGSRWTRRTVALPCSPTRPCRPTAGASRSWHLMPTARCGSGSETSVPPRRCLSLRDCSLRMPARSRRSGRPTAVPWRSSRTTRSIAAISTAVPHSGWPQLRTRAVARGTPMA